jgi:cytochrome oxidase Cu insertion factor (SCO1/SenC/PrrC family)
MAKTSKVMKIVGGVLASLLVVGAAGVYLGTRLDPDPNALTAGAAAPSVELKDVDGKPFSLATLGAKGLRVLVFYRGHW